MLSGKKLKMIFLLNRDVNKYFSADEITKELEISLRTVYRYVKDINSLSDSQQPLVDSKQGIGYRLNTNLPIVQNILSQQNIFENEVSEDIRNIFKIVISNTKQSIFDLENQLFMSTTSVYRLINKANEAIYDFEIKIKFNDNNILDIFGEEDNIRKWMLKLCLEDSEFIEILEKDHSLESIQKQLNQLVIFNGLSEQDKFMISSGVLISISRTKKFDKEDKINCDLDFIIIKEKYNLKYRDIKFIKNILDFIKGFQLLTFRRKVIRTILYSLETLIENDEKRMEYTKDDLVGRLTFHIIELLKRSKYKVSVTNPYLNEIQNKYPFEYNLAGLICFQLGFEFSLVFTKDELAYVAIYLVTLAKKVEIQTSNLNVIIVFDQGLSTGYLLAEEIKRHFSYISIKKIILKESLSSVDLKDVHLIITDSRLYIDKNIPIIVINKLFDSNTINEINRISQTIQEKDTNLSKYFENEIVSVYSKTFEDALSEILEKYFSVRKAKKFQIELLKREKLAPTAVGKNVAFPHNIIEELEDTKIFIGISKNGIFWQGEKVHVIFITLFSPKKIYHMNFFRKLYRFIQEPNLIDELMETKSLGKLKKFIGGQNYDIY